MITTEDLADRMREAVGNGSLKKDGDDAQLPVLFNSASAVQGLEVRPVGAVKVQVERDDVKVLTKLKALAAAAGDDFYYRFPVTKKDGGQDWIEGPSIKCAMAVARTYGNCDTDVRVQDAGDHWIFYARFTDFETGFTLTRAFQQRKNQKAMKTDAARQLDIIFQIGQSKAIRNVIANALSTYTDYAYEEARRGIVARVGKNLATYREKVLARLDELGVDLKRAEVVRGRVAADWLAPDVALCIAELQAIGDGMATVDETYPPLPGGGGDKKPERTDFTPKASEPKPAEQTPPAKAVEPSKAKMSDSAQAKLADEPQPMGSGAAADEEDPRGPDPDAITKQTDKLIDQLEDMRTIEQLEEFEKMVGEDLAALPVSERGRFNRAMLMRVRKLTR